MKLSAMIEQTWEAYIDGKMKEPRLYKIHTSLVELQ